MARFQRVLVANRGEIAGRIVTTLHDMGLAAVVVYSDLDVDAPHVARADAAVHLPGRSANDTYLNIDALLDAAERTDAQAVHPGYGFLSERPAFAEAVIDAGLTWIGPSPAVIAELGDKVAARQRAESVGVPVAPGAELGDDRAAWAGAAAAVGFPLLVKATAGGGGRGMRLVTGPDDLVPAVEGAAREAASAFGDARVFLERYLANGRHIEVQVFGDEHGHRLHLFERDCSVQRRHQKVIEEAPAPFLSAAIRERMTSAAVALAESLDYVGAGTVEFLVDETDEQLPFVFLEMNTRLQVEHPVTEEVTGLDLVQWQIDVAQGRPLPLRQSEITCTGHAIEARVYAEDAAHGYAPQTGEIRAFRAPTGHGLRTDSGVAAGYVVTADYDPMLAKVVAHASDRDGAVARLSRGLADLTLYGVGTNRHLLAAVLADPTFTGTGVVTRFLDERGADLASLDLAMVERHAIAVALAARYRRRIAARVQHDVAGGWRNVGASEQVTKLRLGDHELAVGYSGGADASAGRLEVTVSGVRAAPQPIAVDFRCVAPEAPTPAGAQCVVQLGVDGVLHNVRVSGYDDSSWWTDATDGNLGFVELPRFVDPAAAGRATGGLLAPVPGTVTAVQVRVGDVVASGDPLVLMEAMKMEHAVVAPHDGVVGEVAVTVGSAVDAHDVLVVIRPNDAAPGSEEELA